MTKRPPTTETHTVLRTILSAGVLAVLLLVCAGTAAGATWVVDDDGGADFTSIQAAVYAAAAGDTIEVRSGTYVENVDVNKRLTLIGEGTDVVTVRAADAADHVFEVGADWVDICWVNMSGFTVTGATGQDAAGIYLEDADYCSISDIKTSNNDRGIWLGSSSNNTLRNNAMLGNHHNFGVHVYSLSDYIQNIDTSNLVDGKPIYYLVDRQNEQVPSDAGYVCVVNSTNITVRDLTLTDNDQGVLFAYTNDSKIENVTASNNDRGIYLHYSNRNTLTGNNCSNNGDEGIWLYRSNRNTLTENIVSNNDRGIYLYSSSNDNTLMNNTASNNDHCGIYLYSSSNDNTLMNNTASNNDHYGICVYSSSNDNTLMNNTASNNGFRGIWLHKSSGNALTGNNCSNNGDDGIWLYRSNGNTLTENIVSDNDDHGIGLCWSNSHTLTENIISENRYNFGVYGRRLSHYTHDIDTSNTIDGKPIYYWVYQKDKTVPDDAGYVGVVNSRNITVRDLILTNNLQGIVFAYTENSRIENVTASNNCRRGIYMDHSSNNTLTENTVSNNGWYETNGNDGICMDHSSNNTVSNNTVSNNGNDGIYMAHSSNNTLTENTVSNNDDYGICVSSSSDNNTFYHNNLASNTNCDAHDYDYNSNINNVWDNGAEGNHYSDYTGTDSDGDGIGDTPYPIPGGSSSVDRYPLMAPYTPPIGPQDRSLAQVEGQSEVYWLQNNRLYWVTDWNVINAMSGVPGWGSVNTLPASEFNPATYPQGPRFITTGAESDGLLIRWDVPYGGDGKVYLIEDGEKRWITSPEAFVDYGHNWEDVIDVTQPILDPFADGSPIYSVGQGADLATKNHFIAAYNRNGGADVLGSPTTEVHDAWGYLVQDFPGTSGIPGGVIMYNDIRGVAYYIHGAIWERYYTFVDKSELGPVASDEGEAAILPQGTTGQYTKFETGTIHWISDKDDENVGHSQRGESFVTYGELDALYTSMGGTYSDLGFPVMDQEERDGHGFCEFEGGYIEWDDVSGEYKAIPYEFSVEITSPKNDDIFSKKSGEITFKAEVSGGTPEFTYTWTLDGVTQADNTNERSSEWTLPGSALGGGEHRVKLQVEDAQGNTAESDEIGFEVFDKLVAIVPAKFSNTASVPSIDDIKTRANLVKDYFYEQSYEKEYIVFIFPHSNNEETDGWYRLQRSTSDFLNSITPDMPVPDPNFWGDAMDLAGIQYDVEYNNKIPISFDVYNDEHDYDAGMVVFPIHFRSNMKAEYVVVKADGPYGVWAHELGHALYNLHDMAGDETGAGNIGQWGLMGFGNGMNPPTPIIGFNKIQEQTGWLTYNEVSYSEITSSGNEYPIYYLDDFNIKNEGLLRFETNPKSKVEYYIFEGRHKMDGVSPDDLSTPDYELFPTDDKEEGVMIYRVENNKIYFMMSLGNKIKYELDMRVFEVTLPPENAKYIIPENLKLTSFKDANQLNLKIEEFIPKWIRIWEIQVSIPLGGGGGGAGVPIENNLDVDLHVVSSEGNKVGMNYSTGEYYVQIEGTNTSGNIPSGGYEWISVPMNIGAGAYVDLTPELKELLRNNNSINVEVISTFITYDESGNRIESDPITVNINSENVDRPLILSLPINITFLPPITTMEQFNLTDGRTLPIKFTARNSSTNEFIYDPTVNVTITNSTGHLIDFFTNGTGTGSVRINPTEEQYIVNFHTKDYDLNVGETYTIHVTFGEADTLRGYAITHFTLVDRKH